MAKLISTIVKICIIIGTLLTLNSWGRSNNTFTVLPIAANTVKLNEKEQTMTFAQYFGFWLDLQRICIQSFEIGLW